MRGRTAKLLPNFGIHLAPDAMHIFIDVFVIAVIATLVPYLRSLRAIGTSIGMAPASARVISKQEGARSCVHRASRINPMTALRGN
jgi:hypothetical protein